jgi:precorrin-6x reductase
MQRFAPFAYSAACGQNVNTATGRKQLMESLRERNKKTWAFRCCVEFKMENILAFQLAQQKVVCVRTVM